MYAQLKNEKPSFTNNRGSLFSSQTTPHIGARNTGVDKHQLRCRVIIVYFRDFSAGTVKARKTYRIMIASPAPPSVTTILTSRTNYIYKSRLCNLIGVLQPQAVINIITHFYLLLSGGACGPDNTHVVQPLQPLPTRLYNKVLHYPTPSSVGKKGINFSSVIAHPK